MSMLQSLYQRIFFSHSLYTLRYRKNMSFFLKNSELVCWINLERLFAIIFLRKLDKKLENWDQSGICFNCTQPLMVSFLYTTHTLEKLSERQGKILKISATILARYDTVFVVHYFKLLSLVQSLWNIINVDSKYV